MPALQPAAPPDAAQTPSPRDNRWQAAPLKAAALRLIAFGAPLLAGWLAVRVTSRFYFRPDGAVGLIAWILQAFVVAIVVARVLDRVTRRLVPLAALYSMSLVFPDEAPSRFGAALRGTSIQQLRRMPLGDDPGEASAHALECVTALSRHDRLTRGHCERVRAYSDLIAQEMDMSDHDRNRLAWGALLHDIGKLDVPADILNKTSRPTEDEWDVLAAHPSGALRRLYPLSDWLGVWVLAAAQHHERWDGDGYPNGLAAEEISLGARIVAVADSYDTMVSRRSYKDPISPEAARRELVACSGTQFDPQVVRAFLNVGIGRRRSVGFLGWLAELPFLSTSGAGVAAIPGAVAPVAVAAGLAISGVAPMVGFLPSQDVVTEEATKSPLEDLEIAAPAPTPGEPAGTTGQVPAQLSATVASTERSATSTTGRSARAGATAPQQPRSTTTTSTTVRRRTTTTRRVPVTAARPSTAQPTTPRSTAPPTTTNKPAARPTPPTTQRRTPPTTRRRPTTTQRPTTTRPPTTTTTTAAPTTTTTTTRPPGGAPIAMADSYKTDEKKMRKANNGIRLEVRKNDLEGSAKFKKGSLRISRAPAHAIKVYAHRNSHFHFKTPDGFVGVDSFEYEICNEDNLCDRAEVTITVKRKD